MTDREAEADRVVVFFYDITDDLFHRGAEGADSVFYLCETANDQTGELVEFPAAFQLIEHPVDVVAIFSYVFKEEYLPFGLYIGWSSGKMRQQGKIAPDKTAGARTWSVKGMVRAGIGHWLAGDGLAQRLNVGIAGFPIIEGTRHRRMKGRYLIF